jgi:hypothetical protein
MERPVEPPWGVQMQPLAGKNKRYAKTTDKCQQYAHGPAVNQRAVPEVLRANHWTRVRHIERGKGCRYKNRNAVEDHPQKRLSKGSLGRFC